MNTSKTVHIKNARIIYKDFSSRHHDFNIGLNPTLARKLKQLGWRVIELPISGMAMHVRVLFENLSKVIVTTSQGDILLDSWNIGCLDNADIVSTELCLRGYEYILSNGKTEKLAYVTIMHVVVNGGLNF